jgi:hypothetical protein
MCEYFLLSLSKSSDIVLFFFPIYYIEQKIMNAPPNVPDTVVGGGANMSPDMGGGGFSFSNLGVNPLANVGNNFDLYSSESAIPDANTLVSLKLLSDSDPEFKSLMKEETKWLSAGLATVRSDPYLRIKLGGDGLAAGMKMDNVLKARAEYNHMNSRIDKAADSMNRHTFGPLGSLYSIGRSKHQAVHNGIDGSLNFNPRRGYGSNAIFHNRRPSGGSSVVVSTASAAAAEASGAGGDEPEE